MTQEKAIVVDLDDTLFIRSKLTELLFRLSKLVYKVAIRFEKANPELLNKLSQYSKRIVLTARANDWMKKPTLSQLKRHGISVDGIIMCPRARLYRQWKRKKIAELQEKHGSLTWVDDDLRARK